MANKKAKVVRRRRILFLGLGSIVLIGATLFVIGSYWYQIYLLHQEQALLEDELLALRDKEEELEVDVAKLEDPEYIARYAREKYLFSKEGEFIIKMP